MSPKLLAAACAAGALAFAPAAEAAVGSGTYKGKDDRKQAVQFKVTKDKRLVHFSYSRFKLSCSDGDRLPVKRAESGGSRLTITPGGKFSFTVSYDDGDEWTASGTIKGRRARGKIRFKVRFDAEGQPDPNGSVVCDSGKRRFTAKLR
jgi:hypothetical protein